MRFITPFSLIRKAGRHGPGLRAALALALAALFAFGPTASASDADERMTIVDGVVTGYWAAFSHTSPVIPDGVTEIADQAFMSATIRGITIPDSVTKIGDYAFSGCSFLETVYVPDSVTDLGVGAFSNTKVLTGVRLPAGLTAISDNLFDKAVSLADIEIPQGVTHIGERAFANTALRQVSLPAGLRTIADEGFYGTYLEEINLPTGLESFGKGAFSATKITHIAVPEGITTISDSAFYGCNDLRSVDLPSTVETIGAHAFDFCHITETVVFPESVRKIDDYAFYGGYTADEIILPDGLISIGDWAFSQTTATSVRFPASLREIGTGAFQKAWFTEVVLPEGVPVVSGSMFDNCAYLTDVTLPSTIEVVGTSAFSFCSKLKNINLPGGVAAVGDNAFYQCEKVTVSTVEGSPGEAWCQANGVRYRSSPGEIIPRISKTCSAHFNAERVDEGRPVRLDVATSMFAGYLIAYDENGTVLGDWNPDNMPYASTNGIYRLWTFDLRMTDPGAHTYTFRSSTDGVTYDEGVSAFLLVGHTRVYAVNASSTECADGGEISMTVMADATSNWLHAFENNEEIARWPSSYKNENAQWEVSLRLRGTGQHKITFKATFDGEHFETFGGGTDITVRDTGIRSVEADSAEPGLPCVITAQTGPDARYLHLCGADNAELTRWSRDEAGVAEAEGVSFWTVEHVFDEEGTSACLLSVSLDGAHPGDAVPVTIEIARTVTSLTLDRESLTLNIGAVFGLTAVTEPDGGRIAWLSEDPSVAVADETGRVTAVSPGRTSVIARAVNGPARTVCEVEVVDVFSCSDTFRLPDGLTRLDEAALSGTGAEIVILPQSVRSIGPRVFAGCESLVYIVFPDAPVDPDDRMMEDCAARIACRSGSAADLWALAHGLKPVYVGD